MSDSSDSSTDYIEINTPRRKTKERVLKAIIAVAKVVAIVIRVLVKVFIPIK